MNNSNRIPKLFLFFVISFVYSVIIFYSIARLLPAPLPNWAFPDYLSFYQYLFSNKTNDLPIYLIQALTFVFIPIFIYFFIKIFKYGLWLALLIIPIVFRNNIGEILSLIYYDIPKDTFLILRIIILSIVIGFILKKWNKVDWFNRLKPPKFLTYLLVFIFIFILIYSPKYKYGYENLAWYGRESYHQFHHVNFFLAPINEVLNSKTLLVNADAQYGIFITYLPALIFKFIGISYANFVLYNMIVNIIYACLFFFFLKTITKNFFIALIGTTVFIKIALLRYHPAWEVYTYPSTTPLRYFFDIVALILIYNFFKHKFSFSRLFITSTVIIASFFYTPEFGLPIAAAYIFCLLTDVIITFVKNKKQSLDKLLKYVLSLELAVVLLISIISFITYLMAGSWPNWGSCLSNILFYSKGFEDMPMPVFGYYYLPLLVYLTAYYSILVKLHFRNFKNIQLLVFLLTYGMMIFIYYINLSEVNHLFTVIHPAVLFFFILLAEFCHDFKHIVKSYSQTLITIIVSFFVLIALSAFNQFPNFVIEVIQRLQYRYSPMTKKYYYWPYKGAGFYLQDNNGADFKLAVDKIQKLTPNTKDIVIVSRYDSLLYVMSGKTSLINHPILEYEIRTVSAIKETIETIIQKKPRYVFLYSSKYNQMQIEVAEILANALKKYYSFDSAAGVVDIYRRI